MCAKAGAVTWESILGSRLRAGCVGMALLGMLAGLLGSYDRETSLLFLFCFLGDMISDP